MKSFPSIDPVYKNDIVEMKVSFGMDLRDYFAAKAMQGPFADIYGFTNEELAKAAYGLADAMIEARKK
jgi:hypothetical protein